MNNGIRLCSKHIIHEFITKHLADVRAYPQKAYRQLRREDVRRNRRDAAARRDKHEAAKHRRNAHDAARRDAAHPDGGRWIFNDTGRPVSCVGDNDGVLSWLVGFGDGGEGVPFGERARAEADKGAWDRRD